MWISDPSIIFKVKNLQNLKVVEILIIESKIIIANRLKF